MKTILAATVLVAMTLAGCGSYEPKPLPNRAGGQGAAKTGAAAGGTPHPAGQGAGPAAPAKTADSAAATTQDMVRVKAGVGVGEKGRGYGLGIVSTPIAAYFATKEKLAFNIQAAQNLKLYKANDPNGRGPRTHEEYMQKIIKDGGVPLPQLPPGHQYRYDPETEQLMVERPR
jgi:hypothetical protein